VVDSDLINRVRLEVLSLARESGQVPDATVLAGRLNAPLAGVLHAFSQLGEAHVYVLEPGDPNRLRMANPFSGVPTPFRVEVDDRRYFGNCVWDALGVVSLLGRSGRVVTSCPDCREPMVLEVERGHLVNPIGIVHFSVPARRWWDDIIHT
jgi:hypothetical protein